MDVFIETPRLYIRPLLPTDKQGMYEMDSDAEVHKYVGRQPITTLEQASGVIAFIRAQYAELGIGRWAVIEKGTDDFVGWLGHKLMKVPVNGHVNFIDFGYRLARRHWNKGYATEASLAALQHGVNTLGFKDIFAMTDVDNLASRRVLEKVGFALQEIFPYDAEHTWRTPGQETTWYQYMG